jgi:hypothetical protein
MDPPSFWHSRFGTYDKSLVQIVMERTKTFKCSRDSAYGRASSFGSAQYNSTDTSPISSVSPINPRIKPGLPPRILIENNCILSTIPKFPPERHMTSASVFSKHRHMAVIFVNQELRTKSPLLESYVVSEIVPKLKHSNVMRWRNEIDPHRIRDESHPLNSEIFEQ